MSWAGWSHPVAGAPPRRRPSIRPTLGRLTLNEAQAMLQGLYEANLVQLREGAAGISEALHAGRIVYVRADPRERWQTIRDLWVSGGGDCEDLAAAVAAEATWLYEQSGGELGFPARPVIVRIRPGLAHALVYNLLDGSKSDPSRTGGMGRGR